MSKPEFILNFRRVEQGIEGIIYLRFLAIDDTERSRIAIKQRMAEYLGCSVDEIATNECQD